MECLYWVNISPCKTAQKKKTNIQLICAYGLRAVSFSLCVCLPFVISVFFLVLFQFALQINIFLISNSNILLTYWDFYSSQIVLSLQFEALTLMILFQILLNLSECQERTFHHALRFKAHATENCQNMCLFLYWPRTCCKWNIFLCVCVCL